MRTQREDDLIGKYSLIKFQQEMAIETDDPDFFYHVAQIGDTLQYSDNRSINNNGGAGITRADAYHSAIGEAIERYCAGFYDEAHFLKTSYSEMRDRAVDIHKIVLYSESQYASLDFPYKKIFDETVINWDLGWSVSQKKEIYVPASLVYLPYVYKDPNEFIGPSTSTGLACGRTKEEAILSGLYEVVERDAIANTWLNKLSMPKINFPTGNKNIDRLYEKYLKAGLELILIDITTDIQLPTYFSICISHVEPICSVGASTRLDAESSAIKAIIEAAQTRMWAKYLYKERPRPSFDEFNSLSNFDDHVLLYCYKEMDDNIRFLIDSNTSTPLRTDGSQNFGNASEKLEYCVKILGEKGFEVIYVDLTTPDIKELGYTVVKVIVPGLIPLHGDNRPFLGSNRLYTLPQLLGYDNKKRDESDLNQAPHPFP